MRLLSLLSLWLMASVQSAAAAAPKSVLCKVVGIADGDTLTALCLPTKRVKVRLAEIDCPEKAQAFGTKAKQATSELAFGKQVELRVRDIDRYGRTVAEVVLVDGRSLNRELVALGMCWHYKAYSKDESLGMLEQAAKDKRLGLWVDETPVPPWAFRRAKRLAAKVPN